MTEQARQLGLGGVEAEIEIDRGSWCTPPWVWRIPLVALGLREYDLDPCSNERSTVPAKRAISAPEDGLATPWQFTGDHHQVLVWCNPDYKDVTEWFEFATDAAACGSWTWGVVPHAPNIEAWKNSGPSHAWSLGRVQFVAPPGVKESTPTQEHDLVYWGPTDPPDLSDVPQVLYRIERCM